MSADARGKAERCFAVARSTTFEGERDNAIEQGTKIAQAAGLSLDLFDIPGRARREPGQGVRHDTRWSVAPSAEELAAWIDEALAAFNASGFNRAPIYEPRPPRYCPHGSDMALFGDSCVLCERERRSRADPSARFCPGGCGRVILFGDGCTECDRAGRL